MNAIYRYRVGDRVQVRRFGNSPAATGTVVQVQETPGSETPPVYIVRLDGSGVETSRFAVSLSPLSPEQEPGFVPATRDNGFGVQVPRYNPETPRPLSCSGFLGAVLNGLAGRVPAFARITTGSFDNPFAFDLRGDYCIAVQPRTGATGVVAQRFDSNEFGPEPGWFVWFAYPDGSPAGPDNGLVWFAPPDATPATVAAVLTAAFGNL